MTMEKVKAKRADDADETVIYSLNPNLFVKNKNEKSISVADATVRINMLIEQLPDDPAS